MLERKRKTEAGRGRYKERSREGKRERISETESKIQQGITRKCKEGKEKARYGEKERKN